MHRSIAIVVMTVRRFVRSRLLVVALFIALLVIGSFSKYLIGAIAVARQGEPETASADVASLFSVANRLLGLASWFMASMVGVTLIRRDLADGTIVSVLSKPVSRGEYVMASAIGGAVFLLLVWMVFALVMTIVLVGSGFSLGLDHFVAMFAEFATSLVAMSIALFLSTRLSPWVAASLAVVIFYGAGVVEATASFAGARGLVVPESVVHALQLPFPVVDALDALRGRLSQDVIDPIPTLPGLIHVVDYSAVMVVLAYLSFRRIDLNRSGE